MITSYHNEIIHCHPKHMLHSHHNDIIHCHPKHMVHSYHTEVLSRSETFVIIFIDLFCLVSFFILS